MRQKHVSKKYHGIDIPGPLSCLSFLAGGFTQVAQVGIARMVLWWTELIPPIGAATPC
jgi:hypothetical protein